MSYNIFHPSNMMHIEKCMLFFLPKKKTYIIQYLSYCMINWKCTTGQKVHGRRTFNYCCFSCKHSISLKKKQKITFFFWLIGKENKSLKKLTSVNTSILPVTQTCNCKNKNETSFVFSQTFYEKRIFLKFPHKKIPYFHKGGGNNYSTSSGDQLYLDKK